MTINVDHNTIKEEESHELLSDEVQELIGSRPHWMIRKGSSFFLVIIILLVAFTWIIRYPDIIKAEARLVTIHSPALVRAGIGGRLQKLFIGNEQQVVKGQHLGYIESTGNYDEVMRLQAWVTEMVAAIHHRKYEFLVSDEFPVFSNLGLLQMSYQRFQNEFEVTKQTASGGYFQKKREVLQKDLQYVGSLKRNIRQQIRLQQDDQRLQQVEFEAYESLAKDKVIAPLELDQYKSKLLGKQQGLEQLSAEITSNEMSSHSKRKEILELQKQVDDQRQQFYSVLLELKTEVEKWISQYVLVAPGAGKIMFGATLQENEWVNEGQTLFYVQSPQSPCYAELMAAQNGLGKLKEGQRVMLKVDGYDVSEFGYLEARLVQIAGISSRRDSFLVTAKLVNGLSTNYHKPILFRSGLKAQAEIITDERRLFDRLAGQLNQLWGR